MCGRPSRLAPLAPQDDGSNVRSVILRCEGTARASKDDEQNKKPRITPGLLFCPVFTEAALQSGCEMKDSE